MKKRIIPIFLVFALLFIPLLGSIGIKKADALSVPIIAATPDTTNVVSQISISFQTLVQIPATTGFIMVTFPTGFLLPASINPNYVTINSIFHPLGAVNVAGQVVWFFVGYNLPAGAVNVSFSASAGLITPATPGIYQLQVQTSAEAPQYGPVQINQPSTITQTSINMVPLTPGSLVQYCYLSFKTGPSGALAAGQTISLVFPAGTVLPAYIAPSITINTIAVTSASVVGTTLNLVIPVGVVLGNNTQVNVGIYSIYGMLNPVLSGDYQVKISTTADTIYALTPVYKITGSSITNLNLQVSPLNPGVPASYNLSFLTSASGALVPGDIISITFPSGTTFPSYLNIGVVQINNVACTPVTRYGNTLTLTIPYYLSIPANSWVQITIPASLGIYNPSVGNYNLTVSTSKDTSSVQSNYYQVVGTSISNLIETVTPTTQGAPAEFKFVFATSYSGALLQNSGYILIDFPSNVLMPSGISPANITINGVQVNSAAILSNQRIKITVPYSIGAYSTVAVVISKAAKLKNPTTLPGSSVNTLVSTSADTIPASCYYTITASTISQPQITLTSSGAGATTGVTVNFTTGYSGALRSAMDKIVIIFPSGFIVPVNISKDLITTNTYSTSSVYVYGNRVEITPNIGAPANTNINVIIDKLAGIKNPSNPSVYTLQAYTSPETSIITSNGVNIITLPKTVATISPANPDGLNGYYKTIPSIFLIASSPTDASPTIFYSLNGASFQTYFGGITVPNGDIVLAYYSKDRANNTEEQQTLTLKVDTLAPVISVTSPINNFLTNQEALTIIGKTEVGAKLAIGNSSIEVSSTGDFSTTIKLMEGVQTIPFIAQDLAGNVGYYQLTVTLDTIAPKITIVSPLMFSTTVNKTCQVVGRTEPGAILTANGKTILVNSDGSFFYELNLSLGQNAIEFFASDSVGNLRKNTLIITYLNQTSLVLQVGNTTAQIGTRTVHLLTAPININGTVMVPLRFISEAFGAEVNWNPIFKSIAIKLNDSVIVLQIGNSIASVSGKTFKLSSAPLLRNSTTLVPIRFVSEVLGAEVTWVQKTQTVKILYPKY